MILCPRLLPLLLVLGLLSSGCSVFDMGQHTSMTPQSVDLQRFEADSTQLPGRWQWIRTTIYQTGGVATPASTGKTRALVFLETDTVDVYENDRLTRREATSSYLDRPSWGISNDTLVITTAFLDGPETLYVRDER